MPTLAHTEEAHTAAAAWSLPSAGGTYHPSRGCRGKDVAWLIRAPIRDEVWESAGGQRAGAERGREGAQRGPGGCSKELAGDQCATGGVRAQPDRACCQARVGREPCEHGSPETGDPEARAGVGVLPLGWAGSGGSGPWLDGPGRSGVGLRRGGYGWRCARREGGADPGLTGQKQGDLEMGAGGGRTLCGQTGDAR